jgi:cardiolipin synthase (CMP-forming)
MTTVAPNPRDARILTIPNVISLIRLLLVPVFVWLLFSRHDRGNASLLLGGIGATDWVDGYIARRFDQGSTFGKIIDPVADRVLLGVGVLAIVIDRSVPLIIGIIVIFREVVISLATVVLAALGARRIDVTWIGKCGTFGLMVAFPCFLASHSTWAIRDWFRWSAWLWIIPSIVLSYWAAASYIPIGREALRSGRAARLKS